MAAAVINVPLRFGVMTLQSIPWPVLAERWSVLDASTFDSAWVGDHLTLSRFPDSPLLEGWTALPALAILTHRIRLGTMVTSIAYRNPVLLAKQAATLDQISDGRLEFGIGAGGNPRDHAISGVPNWNAGERVARFREFIEIVDRLLTSASPSGQTAGKMEEGDTPGYEGRYYRTQADRLAPQPVQRPRPPLTLAAFGPVTIKLAAQYADSWNPYVMRPSSPEDALRLTRDRIGMLEDACATIGRDPSTIVRSLLCWPFMPESPFTSLRRSVTSSAATPTSASRSSSSIGPASRRPPSEPMPVGPSAVSIAAPSTGSTMRRFRQPGLIAGRHVYSDDSTLDKKRRRAVSVSDNVALVRRVYEAVWNDGDLAVADELIAPAEVHHSHGGTEPGGPEAQKQGASRFRSAFPDHRLGIELIVDGGELVAVRWRIKGSHAATGRPITDYTGVNIFRIVDGQIVEIWDTRDDLELYAQIGMIPPRSDLAPQLFRSAKQQ